MKGRSLARTLVGLAVVTAPLLPAVPVQAADPSPAPGVPAPAEVIVEKIGPAVPTAKGTLALTGRVVNRGTVPLRAADVSLNVRKRPFTFRAELSAIAGDRAPLREAVEVAEDDLPATIAPGASVPWKLSVKIEDLKLGGNGVYPIAVTVRSDGAGALDTRTTFLPYVPDPKGYTPTKLSWLWPVLDRPVREPDGTFPQDQAGDRFKAGSRLQQLAAAPGTRAVGWFVDPQLLDDATALAGAHRERVDGKVEKVGAGDGDAGQWLAALRQLLAGKPNAATPYADPDLVGLVGEGGTAVIDRALDRARTVTSTVFGRQSDTAVVWPPGGLADAATLSALRRLGARTVVLSGEQFPVLETLSYTPTGRGRVATDRGDLEVLIADAGLTRVLEGDLRAPGAFALAQQQLLAETALITLERPNAPRAVLMAPPRRWDPPAGGAKRLLDAFAAAPWMTPSGLDTLSQTRVPPELAGTVVAEQPALEAPRLPADYVGVLRGAARSATQLRGVLAEGDRLAEDHDTAVLRSAAATWIGNLDAGRTYVQQVRQWVNGDRAKVKLIGRGVVTFSGERGTIPVTISNGLSRPIKIRPTITPLEAGKLRARSPELLTIAAGRKKEVRIPAEAGEDGVIRVSVELRDAAGNRYGDPFFLGVRVTNYGNVGLIVVLGGGGLLFAVAIVRNVRRVRRHRDRVRGQSAARHDAATRTEDAEEPVQL